MIDKPTPSRQPDLRLSNCVLEGGRSKEYPPPPPPAPPADRDMFRELPHGALPLWVPALVILTVLVAVVYGIAQGWR